MGRARLSGADLKGKAKRFGASYARSRDAIISRLARAGIPHRVVGTGKSGDPMFWRSANRLGRFSAFLLARPPDPLYKESMKTTKTRAEYAAENKARAIRASAIRLLATLVKISDR